MPGQESAYQTVRYEVDGGVATVTLNRPERLNAFNARMQQEVQRIWRALRLDTEVRCVILTGAGEKAFCTGIDRDEQIGSGGPDDADLPVTGFRSSEFHIDDPGERLGPKSNDLWKPVVAAVNGMACGGAFYFLGEVDIVLAAEHASFFDPHVTYGMPASYETIHMLQRMPIGELLRMQLLGAHERMSAERAREIGLVSEVVPGAELLTAARRVADIIAASPALAVEATVRAAWAGLELSRSQALGTANAWIAMGMTAESLAEGQRRFASGERVQWRLR